MEQLTGLRWPEGNPCRRRPAFLSPLSAGARWWPVVCFLSQFTTASLLSACHVTPTVSLDRSSAVCCCLAFFVSFTSKDGLPPTLSLIPRYGFVSAWASLHNLIPSLSAALMKTLVSRIYSSGSSLICRSAAIGHSGELFRFRTSEYQPPLRWSVWFCLDFTLK